MLSASDLMRTIGRPIAYHPALARMVGGVNAAIFLSQLIYWDERMEDAELGVYKTAEQWEAETGLSVREQTTARRQLRDRGLITETHKRIEHKLYFKLDRDAFDRLIAGVGEAGNPEQQNVDSRNAETQFGNSENANTETPKAPSPNHPKRSSLIKTEITTEITEDISSDCRFQEFWDAYPKTARRVAKSKCLQVWKKLNLDAEADAVIAHVRCMSLTEQWKGGYEPAPMTYLNQLRWEDGVPADTGKGGGKPGPSKHTGFDQKNYGEGIGDDGRF